MPQEWRPGSTGICPGTPSLQHLHLWLDKHHLKNVYLNQRPNNHHHACWWRLTNSRKGAKAIVGKYLQTWKLKLTTTEAVLAVFRLSSISTTRKLNVSWKSTTTKKPCSSGPSTYTSEWCCTGHSRTADTSSHFAKRWHHALHSSGVLLTLAMVLVQQHWEQPP